MSDKEKTFKGPLQKQPYFINKINKAYNNPHISNIAFQDSARSASDAYFDEEMIKSIHNSISADTRTADAVEEIETHTYRTAETIKEVRQDVVGLSKDLEIERERLKKAEEAAEIQRKKERNVDIWLAVLAILLAVVAWLAPSPFG